MEGEDSVKENSVTISGLALSKDTFSLGCATAFLRALSQEMSSVRSLTSCTGKLDFQISCGLSQCA